MKKRSRNMRVSENFANGISNAQRNLKQELGVKFSTTDLTEALSKNASDFEAWIREKKKKNSFTLGWLK